MSTSKRRTLGIATTTLALSALIVVWLVSASKTSQAQSDSPSAPSAEELDLEQVVPVTDRHVPFTPYATDVGTVAYEDHRVGPPTDENDVRPSREAVDDAQAFAEENGYDVHQAWSAYSRASAARARVKGAEYESGSAGLGDVGVGVP